MNEHGKSDGPIVPRTPANNGGGNRLDRSHPAASPAEQVEERGQAKGNSLRGSEDRTRSRQEPGAVVPHAGICPGGAPQGASLPESPY